MRFAKHVAGLSVLVDLAVAYHTGHHYYYKGRWSQISSAISTTSTTLAISESPCESTSVPLSTTVSFIPASSTAVPTASPTASSLSIATATYTTSSTATPTGSDSGIWRPSAGTTWQIVLSSSPKDTALNVQAYDIDLFDNTAATIKTFKDAGHKVICYFSAGTFEDWREDAESFQAADKGSAMEGWAGEWWLDTNSPNVRAIMAKRIDLAVTKGCDAIDPDNMDAYGNNGGGLNLQSADAINYINYLATIAHSKGLAIGLKNAGAIVSPSIVAAVDFAVNEQCAAYSECSTWQAFISANKPVFAIEYTTSTTDVTSASMNTACSTVNMAGFSTLLKNMILDDWLIAC
ncbi:hypothetical protein BP6252_13629 [Coleophoma cylindrospora]|uniref:alpha-galactosidase n=1 Tax=Coleophoma cylindrospora TaxID=1849047 RepID=A0A3D8Q9B3_9HELO|nr:hypothetical protein BP6252_13629 [Coleophoma cylindrospora]